MRTAFWLMTLISVSGSSVALAQEEGGHEAKGRAGMDIAIGSSSDDAGSTFALSPLLYGSYHVMDSVRLDLQWGFAYGSVSPESGDGDSAFVLGNPYLGGAYEGHAGPIHYSAGVGIAIPLASVSDGTDGLYDATAYGMAIGMRGARNAWLFAVDRFGIIVPIEVAWRQNPGDGLFADLELVLAFMPYTGDLDDVDTEIELEAIVTAGYQMGALELGADFGLVNLLSGGEEDEDHTQLSLQLFTQYSFGAPFVRAAFLLNLDEPVGFSFDDGGIWGLTVGGGSEF